MNMRAIILLFLGVFMIGGYGQNIYKFVNCDFEAPYKCEAVHGVGIIPIIGIFTGWADFGR